MYGGSTPEKMKEAKMNPKITEREGRKGEGEGQEEEREKGRGRGEGEREGGKMMVTLEVSKTCSVVSAEPQYKNLFFI